MATTYEEAEKHDEDKTVELLNELLQKNVDAEKGFREALLKAEDVKLINYLTSQAATRSTFISELQNELNKLNQPSEKTGTLVGDLHRTWIDVKTSFTGETDAAILKECIREDKININNYEDAIEFHNFPENILNIISNQLHIIKLNLNNSNDLEYLIS